MGCAGGAQRCRTGSPFAASDLDAALTRYPLAPADRRLATELVYGVLRRRGTLDAAAQPVPHSTLRRRVYSTCCGLGAISLRSSITFRARCDQHRGRSRTGCPRATRRGLVNAVLRGLSRMLTNERAPARQRTACRSRTQLPPSGPPGVSRSGRLIPRATSHQPSGCLLLSAKWLGRLGFAETERWGFWFNAPPPLWLRVNELQISREAFLQKLSDEGISAERVTPAVHSGSEPRGRKEVAGLRGRLVLCTGRIGATSRGVVESGAGLANSRIDVHRGGQIDSPGGTDGRPRRSRRTGCRRSQSIAGSAV